MNSRSITAELTVSKDADDYDENKNDDQVFHSTHPYHHGHMQMS
jgi:hypothetical protein